MERHEIIDQTLISGRPKEVISNGSDLQRQQVRGSNNKKKPKTDFATERLFVSFIENHRKVLKSFAYLSLPQAKANNGVSCIHELWWVFFCQDGRKESMVSCIQI